MKYRRKSNVIEAVQFGDPSFWYQFPNCPILHICSEGGVNKIRTPEGDMKISEGDWIIRAHSKELGDHFYPVKPDYFAEHYEKVDNEQK